MVKFDNDIEEQVLKHKKQLEDVDEERLTIKGEVVAIEDGILVLQNEFDCLTLRMDNVVRENKAVEENIIVNKQTEKHQDSLLRVLGDQVKREQEKQEHLEVQLYEQSVKMATLFEDSDKVIQFMEEFVKKHTTGKALDVSVFKDLGETDKENVNELLMGFGLVYKETF
jgi:hypothetical protein